MSRLGDICEIHGRVGWKGYTVKDLTEDGPYVLGANDITLDNQVVLDNAKHLTREKYEESPEIFVKKDDILVVKVGSTIGKVGIINKEIGEASINPNCVIVRANKINPYYLYYYLCSPQGYAYLVNNSSASGQPALNQKDLGDMEIPIIDDMTQEKIAKLLNCLNNKIELNNKINSELEVMAKEIYDYRFIQFDFPDENGKPYKSSGGKMVWSEELKREIPEGWEVEKLSYYINGEKAGDRGVETEKGNYNFKVQCIRGADFQGLNTGNGGEYPIRFINNKNSYKTLEYGNILIEISGGSPTQSTGRTCYINKYTLNRFKNPLITSNFCKVIELKNTNYIYKVFCELNKLYDSDIFFGFEGKTSGIKNFLYDVFIDSYKTTICPDILTFRFNEIVVPLFEKIQQNCLQNQKLSELRDFLLPMLMNGQVTVR